MRIISDGRVAISIELDGGTIRIHPSEPDDDDDHPPIIGVGKFKEVASGVVAMIAFKADGMTARHVKLIYAEMLSMGYSYLLAERLGSHKLPDAEEWHGWPYEGWQRVDLVKSRLTQRKKGPSGPSSFGST